MVLSNYKRKKHPTNCQNCGKEFLAYKKGKATKKYCSKECYPTTKEQYSCESCGVEVVRTPSNIKKKIYCSKKCADKGKESVSLNVKDKIPKECAECEEIFFILPCHSKRKFCSKKCADENKKSVYSEKPKLRNLFNRNRGKALKRDGYKCTECGVTNEEHLELTGKSLHVHHIIPHQFFKEDNIAQHDLSNLKTVCNKCHRGIHSELKPTEYKKEDIRSI